MKKQLRQKATEMSKIIDEFVEGIEKDIQDKEDELFKKAKDMALIGERERKVKELEEALKKERNLIEKEKKANRVRTEQLDLKEKEFTSKLARINADFGDLKPM